MENTPGSPLAQKLKRNTKQAIHYNNQRGLVNEFPMLNDLKTNYKTSDSMQHKVQKEIKIRDFEALEKISQYDLEAIELSNLKKLYMIQPRNKSCILYRLQMKQNSNFDGTKYSDTMIDIFADCYQLPNLMKRYDQENRHVFVSTEPYDELFIWSLLLYSGTEQDLNLSRYFWSKSKHPLACCLVAMIVYKFLRTKNFIPTDLKEKLRTSSVQYEKMASELLCKCFEENQLIAQDLLICQSDIFFKQTVLELGIKAEALEFVGQTAVQQLLTDIWFDRISPHTSFWLVILPLVFFPCLFLPISFFRSDIVEIINLSDQDDEKYSSSKTSLRNTVYPGDTEKYETKSGGPKPNQITNQSHSNVPNNELSYRNTLKRLKGLDRIYSFYNAPIVKFINHFIFYILFLMLYSGFILFDYRPEQESSSTVIRITIGDKIDWIKVTICELLIILCVLIFQIDEIRSFIEKKTGDNRLKTKIKYFFTENTWNIYDLVVFITFYAALIVRFLPLSGEMQYIGKTNCYEAARVLYCFNLILWYIKILEAVSCLPFWGPKIIIMKAMIKKLSVFVVLILVFLIPFGTSVESLLNKTQPFSINVILSAFNRAYWTIFGELLGILEEFNHYQCTDTNSTISNSFGSKSCSNDLPALFLYAAFGFYTITCNLLILNMIIATFASTVEHINADSHKFYQFQRYDGVKEFSQKTIVPPPFVVIEYFLMFCQFLVNFLNGTTDETTSKDNFRIEDMDKGVRKVYESFEMSLRDQYYYEAFIKYRDQNYTNVDLMQALRRLENNLDLFKIWSQEQQNEKFRLTKALVESLSLKLDQHIVDTELMKELDNGEDKTLSL